jgi:hypothetical protein
MSNATNLPFLTERNGSLIFRRRIPAKLREVAGQYEWKRALGRGSRDNSRIRLELRLLTEATDEAVAQLERGIPVQPDLLEQALRALYPDQQQNRLAPLNCLSRARPVGYGDRLGQKARFTTLTFFTRLTRLRALNKPWCKHHSYGLVLLLA